MTIDLNPQEQALLIQMLERELSELPSEIRRTRTSSYRDGLKEQEHALRDLHARLKAAAVA
jgi:hypothetical protein